MRDSATRPISLRYRGRMSLESLPAKSRVPSTARSQAKRPPAATRPQIAMRLARKPGWASPAASAPPWPGLAATIFAIATRMAVALQYRPAEIQAKAWKERRSATRPPRGGPAMPTTMKTDCTTAKTLPRSPSSACSATKASNEGATRAPVIEPTALAARNQGRGWPVKGAARVPIQETAPAAEPMAMLLRRPRRSEIQPPAIWKRRGKTAERVK